MTMLSGLKSRIVGNNTGHKRNVKSVSIMAVMEHGFFFKLDQTDFAEGDKIRYLHIWERFRKFSLTTYQF